MDKLKKMIKNFKHKDLEKFMIREERIIYV